MPYPSKVEAEFLRAFETSNRGTTSLGVSIQDQTTDVLTVPFLQARATITLASDAAIDDRTLDLVAGHGTLFGETIELAEIGTSFFMQTEVIDPAGLAAPGTPVPGNIIDIDQLVNRTYTTAGALAARSTDEMNIDGSVTPQIFSILPLSSQAGDMVRVIFEMRDTASMDFSTFAGQPSLNRGCMIRVKRPDGTFKNLFNFKDNGDIIEQGFDHNFLLPRQGNTIKGFTSRVTWGGQSKHGVVIRVDGALGEELQMVIQDDLTTLDRFHLIAQGHELQL
jgi:hypothetical protein